MHLCLPAAFICLLLTAPLLADPIVVRRGTVAANRPSGPDLEVARTRFPRLERVEFPLRLRQLDNEITLLATRVEMLRERIQDYQRFRVGSPFLVTLQNAKLQLLEAEQDLRLLRRERIFLRLHVRDEIRLRRSR